MRALPITWKRTRIWLSEACAKGGDGLAQLRERHRPETVIRRAPRVEVPWVDADNARLLRKPAQIPAQAEKHAHRVVAPEIMPIQHIYSILLW